MKKSFSGILLIIALLMLFSGLFSQENNYDLLTEPYIERPVSMHKNQIEFLSGYKISIGGGFFENDKTKTNIQENGTAAIGHREKFSIKYGILENFEFAAEMDYFKQGLRSTSMNYFDINEAITLTSLTEKKGFEDLLLSATFRLPLNLKLIDIGINTFFIAPVSKFQPEAPENTVERVVDPILYTTINLKETIPNGTGTAFYGIGSEIKLRASKIAMYLAGSVFIPLGESENIYWDEELDFNIFNYQQIEYTFLPQSITRGVMEIHFQPKGWFQLYSGISLMMMNNGWFERNNLKYSTPDIQILELRTGFEIQVSPRIRITEEAIFPLMGKNTYSNFSIFTGLGINIFTRN